jgi:hypothetical protein
MAEYALVENGVCTNVVIADAQWVSEQTGTWIDISGNPGVGIGWSWDGSTWTAPAVVVPAPSSDELKAAALELANRIALQETVATKIETLPDTDKATLAYLYDEWSGDGVALKTGDIVRVGDVPYRVLQDHTTQSVWMPETATSLFTPLREVTGVNPDPWVQPSGAQDAYAIGDRVTHDNPNDGGALWVYESAIDSNTTEPGRDGTFDRWWTPIASA